MKPRSILSLLLATGLLTPLLQAQDAPAKIREIEQKELLKQHQKAVNDVIVSAREIRSDSSANTTGILGKRIQWLTVVDRQIDPAKKAAAAKEKNMTESAQTLNQLAWDMVTSPNPRNSELEVALKLATIAIDLIGDNPESKPNMVDTKARALFMLGKRDEAITEQENAVASAANEEQKAGLEKTLAAYRKGELPEGPVPAYVETAEDVLAAKDLRSRLDEIVALQRQVDTIGKEVTEATKSEKTRLEQELQKRMNELARLTELKDPAIQRQVSAGATYLMGKLRSIVLPSVDFEDVTLVEAVEQLRKRSIELDKMEPDPGRKGLNIVVRLPVERPGAAAGKENTPPEPPRIKSLHLRNVPLSEVLKYICEATRFRYKIDEYSVTLLSPTAAEDLFNRTFIVPPDFGSSLVSIQELLKMCGVKFQEGASATLVPPNLMVIRNTPTEIDKIELLVQAVGHSRPDRVAPGNPNAR